MRKLVFFDTTLRDGEQAPGFSMKTEEKIRLALQLEKLGVDIIEAGFPVTSPGDFEAVQRVSEVITKASVCGLSRANKNDIQVAWNALKLAKHPRLHIVIATSDIHLHYKLKKSREEVLAMVKDAVTFAKTLCDDIEFSSEDATRSDLGYLCKVVETAIDAGATTVNIPDTVGYIMPEEMYNIIDTIVKKVPNISKAVISVHNHNDLGLGVATSLAAVRAGATQIECTINGIGERAGNAALEEIVMAFNVRKDYYKGIECAIDTKELYRTSRMLTNITGVGVQPNKAIVGKNAFAHESGIHQDGFLKERTTYEIMTPESVGVPASSIVLGKHSGRNAFITRLKELGYTIDKDALEVAFAEFKVLADKKKEVYDEDIEAIVLSKLSEVKVFYHLEYVGFISGTGSVPTVTVRLRLEDGSVVTDASIGEGPVDAAFKSIDRVAKVNGDLKTYRINAVTPGTDAQGEVTVSVEFDKCGYNVGGRGYSTDVLIGSVEAYVSAVNAYLLKRERLK